MGLILDKSSYRKSGFGPISLVRNQLPAQPGYRKLELHMDGYRVYQDLSQRTLGLLLCFSQIEGQQRKTTAATNKPIRIGRPPPMAPESNESQSLLGQVLGFPD